MALTFTQVGDKGLNAQALLQHANLIESFTYDLKEAPEVYQDIVKAYRDPMIQQFMIDGSVVTGGNISSDQMRWYEKGRLQNVYKDDVASTGFTSGVATLDFSGSATTNFDIRKGETLILADNANNKIEEVYVVSAAADDNVVVRSKLDTPLVTGTTGLTVFHASSDYPQGSTIDTETITYEGIWRSNNPIIIRDFMRYDRSKIGQMVQFTDDLKNYTIDKSDMDKRFDVAFLFAAIFGHKSEGSSAAKALDINGSESVMSAIGDRGNTASGTFASITDVQNLISLLNARKGSKSNLILADLSTMFQISNMLAGATPYVSGGANWGEFYEGEMYRKFGYEGFTWAGGWNFAYKHWDFMDDEAYYGALATNTAKPKGLIIPKGQVQLASGGSAPYLSVLSRDGMDNKVSYSGNVVGIGHYDGIEMSYTKELLTKVVSAKDFVKLI